MNNLTNTKRITLVTGGGIGIGRASCIAFARAGDHVVVTDILEREGRELAVQLVADGLSAEFLPLDVRSTAEADSIVGGVIAEHGRLDVVVTNAGIAHRLPISEMTDEEWDQTFDIDLKGMLRVIRPALPAMREARSGSIICLSSIMGIAYGWDEHVHYSAAKSGVIGLVRGLAVELAGEGIRVNGVAPGYIRTAQLLSEKHSLGPEGGKKAASLFRWAGWANRKTSPM